MKKILFLCTGNSCRSQMAEGWMKHFYGDDMDVYSAGIEVHGINPYAVTVMQEEDIDISKQKSQLVEEFKDINFDLVVTVCDNAKESCPIIFTKGKVIHHSFPDPPALAKELEGENKYVPYRQVRDLIKSYVKELQVV